MTSIINAPQWSSSNKEYFLSIDTNTTFFKAYESDIGSSDIREISKISLEFDINDIAYNTRHPGLLAVASKDVKLFNVLDDTDSVNTNVPSTSASLNTNANTSINTISNANSNTSTITNVLSGPSASAGTVTGSSATPLVILESTRSATSVSYHSSNNGLAVGHEKSKNKPGIKYYEAPLINNKLVRGFLQGESVYSLKFSNNVGPSLICGTSSGLKVIDVRGPSNPVLSVSTQYTHYINTGLGFSSDRYFSSISNDETGSVAIWDLRNFKKRPCLEVNNVFNDEIFITKNVAPCYRFSNKHSSELASLQKATTEQSYIKRWLTGQYGKSQLFIHKYKNVKNNIGRAASFDYIDDDSMVVLSYSGNVSKYKVYDSDFCLRFDNYDSFVIAGDGVFEDVHSGNSEAQLRVVSEHVPIPVNVLHDHTESDAASGNSDSAIAESVAEEQDEPGVDDQSGITPSLKSPHDVLQNDISNIMYKRALNQYSLNNLLRNSDLFSKFNISKKRSDEYSNFKYEQLRVCWKWLSHSNSKSIGNKGNITIEPGLDLSFEGIYNLWHGIKFILNKNTRRSTRPISEKEYLKILAKILDKEKMQQKLQQQQNNSPGLIHKQHQHQGSQSAAQMTYISTIRAKTTKRLQREYCLFSCGWYITQEQFDDKIWRLTEIKLYEKAAGLCVFSGDVLRAIELLQTMGESEKTRKRQRQESGTSSSEAPTPTPILSTTLASEDQKPTLKLEDARVIAAAMMGFYNRPQDEEGEQLWKKSCQVLAADMSSPPLRAIFAYLVDQDWWDVVTEPSLALKEKLLVALKFLSDKQLSEWLEEVTRNAVASGDPEGIMLTGLTQRGITLLQSFCDSYGDVQSCALISSFAVPRFFQDQRVEMWVSCYSSLLNSWKLFSTRAQFDIARRKLSRNYLMRMQQKLLQEQQEQQESDLPAESSVHMESHSEAKIDADTLSQTHESFQHGFPITSDKRYYLDKKPRQLYLKCIQCDRDISHLLHADKEHDRHRQTRKDKSTVTCICGASLPKCAICLYSLGAPVRYGGNSSVDSEFFRDWASFCLNCNHGMHAKHADDWFAQHKLCPVPDCDCKCSELV